MSYASVQIKLMNVRKPYDIIFEINSFNFLFQKWNVRLMKQM